MKLEFKEIVELRTRQLITVKHIKTLQADVEKCTSTLNDIRKGITEYSNLIEYDLGVENVGSDYEYLVKKFYQYKEVIDGLNTMIEELSIDLQRVDEYIELGK